MAQGVQWHGDEFKRELRRKMNARLHRAAMVVERHAKKLISVPGTGIIASGANHFKADFGEDRVVPQWGWKAGTNKEGKKTISRGGTTIEQKFKSKKKSIYGAFPSKPGDPPHKQTGQLRMSVTHELDESRSIARVGTNKDYGRWLELGTSRMKPRPWLRRALAEMLSKVETILAKTPLK